MKFFIPFLIAYLGSKLVFSFFDFKYAIFSEPFDVVKLLIDIGVFGILFFAGTTLFNKFYVAKSNNGS